MQSAVLVLLPLLALCVWVMARTGPRGKPAGKPTALVFLGSGGHTGEMLRMLSRIDLHGLALTLVYSHGDEFSLKRATGLGATASFAVPRARHVGQPLWRAAGGAFWSLVACFRIVYTTSPGLLLCNGPGTCVMLVVAAKTLRIIGLGRARIVYVESFARVESLSLTGKLLYHFADRFVVQWEPLQRKYPKSEYIGLLV